MEIIPIQQALQNLPKSSIQTNSNEISIYKGELSKDILNEKLIELRTAFPELTRDFFVLLKKRILDNNFSDERLKDSIDKVIDTYKFKAPKIADIIDFDIKAKTYTYDQVCEQNLWSYVDAVDLEIGVPKYVEKQFSKYFKKWSNK